MQEKNAIECKKRLWVSVNILTMRTIRIYAELTRKEMANKVLLYKNYEEGLVVTVSSKRKICKVGWSTYKYANHSVLYSLSLTNILTFRNQTTRENTIKKEQEELA